MPLHNDLLPVSLTLAASTFPSVFQPMHKNMAALARPARQSTETDRRHLLTGSTCPSETSSFVEVEAGDGERTPRAQSPASAATRFNSQQQETTVDLAHQGYRGFPSRAHYLAALNAWAESKRYLEPGDSGISGYYGQTTMEEYAQRPRVELGFSSWKRHRKEKKDAKRRSVT